MSSNETPREPHSKVVLEVLEKLEKEMRKVLGDEAVEFSLRLQKQISAFKTDLTSAVEGGKSGQEMVEFLNGHAWLWKYFYEDVERDPQYKAMIERSLCLCARHVPEEWHRAVKMADENREHVAALRKQFP